MINLDTQRGGRDHPHIDQNIPCFGGHGTSFMEFLVNGQLDVLYELLIQYLETMNMADSYGSRRRSLPAPWGTRPRKSKSKASTGCE
jgi:hypothetical protein